MADRDRATVGVELVAEGSTPSSRQTAITCAANASFSSITSMSSIDIPACFEHGPDGLDRADAHDLGVDPDTDEAMIRASGLMPSSPARSSA